MRDAFWEARKVIYVFVNVNAIGSISCAPNLLSHAGEIRNFERQAKHFNADIAAISF